MIVRMFDSAFIVAGGSCVYYFFVSFICEAKCSGWQVGWNKLAALVGPEVCVQHWSCRCVGFCPFVLRCQVSSWTWSGHVERVSGQP